LEPQAVFAAVVYHYNMIWKKLNAQSRLRGQSRGKDWKTAWKHEFYYCISKPGVWE